ncbi:hypothetical protein P9112_010639 [Eukaryota sp. TZLM1-RC]
MKENISSANWTLNVLLQAQKRGDKDVFVELNGTNTDTNVEQSLTHIVTSVDNIQDAEPIMLKPSTFPLLTTAAQESREVCFWLVKSFVISYTKNSSQWTLKEVEDLINSFCVEYLHPKTWSEILLEPLKEHKKLELVLMKFSCVNLLPKLLELVNHNGEVVDGSNCFNTKQSGSGMAFSEGNRMVLNNCCNSWAHCNFAAIDFNPKNFKIAIKRTRLCYDWDSIGFWTMDGIMNGYQNSDWYDTNGGGSFLTTQMNQEDILYVNIDNNQVTFSLNGSSDTKHIPSGTVFGIWTRYKGNEYSIVDY